MRNRRDSDYMVRAQRRPGGYGASSMPRKKIKKERHTVYAVFTVLLSIVLWPIGLIMLWIPRLRWNAFVKLLVSGITLFLFLTILSVLLNFPTDNVQLQAIQKNGLDLMDQAEQASTKAMDQFLDSSDKAIESIKESWTLAGEAGTNGVITAAEWVNDRAHDANNGVAVVYEKITGTTPAPTEIPTVAPTAEPEVTPEPAPVTEKPKAVIALPENAVVYHTENGKYYHVTEDCSGMAGASPCSLKEAIDDGFKACPNCSAPTAEMLESEEKLLWADANDMYHTTFDCKSFAAPYRLVTLTECYENSLTPCPDCGANDYIYEAPDDLLTTPEPEETLVPAMPTDGATTEPTEEATTEPEITEEATLEPTEEATTALETTEEVTAEPTEEATTEPEVTEEATIEPTEEATTEPEATEEATSEPTEEATTEPEATEDVTAEPEVTEESSAAPAETAVTAIGTDITAEPEASETPEATEEPSEEPTEEPTDEPSEEPTEEPTDEPTEEPTEEPTAEPTAVPTPSVTLKPIGEAMVYHTTNGGWYHTIPDCKNMSMAKLYTLESSVKAGLKACKRCNAPVMSNHTEEYTVWVDEDNRFHTGDDCSFFKGKYTLMSLEDVIKQGMTACMDCGADQYVSLLQRDPEPAETPAAAETAELTDEQRMEKAKDIIVFYSNGSRYYHTSGQCQTMKMGSEHSMYEAISTGHQWCPVCQPMKLEDIK